MLEPEASVCSCGWVFDMTVQHSREVLVAVWQATLTPAQAEVCRTIACLQMIWNSVAAGNCTNGRQLQYWQTPLSRDTNLQLPVPTEVTPTCEARELVRLTHRISAALTFSFMGMVLKMVSTNLLPAWPSFASSKSTPTTVKQPPEPQPGRVLLVTWFTICSSRGYCFPSTTCSLSVWK